MPQLDYSIIGMQTHVIKGHVTVNFIHSAVSSCRLLLVPFGMRTWTQDQAFLICS